MTDKLLKSAKDIINGNNTMGGNSSQINYEKQREDNTSNAFINNSHQNYGESLNKTKNNTVVHQYRESRY